MRQKPKRAHPGNPWGLSPATVRALDALCEAGSNKGAAQLLHLEPCTISDHMKWAMAAMRAEKTTVASQLLPSATTPPSRMALRRLHVVLAWDRWRRQQQVQRPAAGGGHAA